MKIEFEKGFWRNFLISFGIVLSLGMIIYQKHNQVLSHTDWSFYPNFLLMTFITFPSLVLFMGLFMGFMMESGK